MPTSTAAFTRALRKLPLPGRRQRRFLRAHHQAPGRAETATNLAEAAGYKSFDGISLQYGLLASRVGKALLKRDANLTLLVELSRPRSVTTSTGCSSCDRSSPGRSRRLAGSSSVPRPPR